MAWSAVRRLPAEELQAQALDSRARARALVRRLLVLRQVVDARRRTLERLRARMWQLRGGARPH
jgi:hypothetical protein